MVMLVEKEVMDKMKEVEIIVIKENKISLLVILIIIVIMVVIIQ